MIKDIIKLWLQDKPPFYIYQSEFRRHYSSEDMVCIQSCAGSKVVAWFDNDGIEVGSTLQVSMGGEGVWRNRQPVADLADPQFFDKLSAALNAAADEIYSAHGQPNSKLCKTEYCKVPMSQRDH